MYIQDEVYYSFLYNSIFQTVGRHETLKMEFKFEIDFLKFKK